VRFSPGFERDLGLAGAVSVNVPKNIKYEWPGGATWPQRDFGLSILSATRPVIEFVLRRRIEASASIALRPESCVIRILPVAKGTVAKGIRIETGLRGPETLAADLVVDASGRGTLTSAFLDAHGWGQPMATEVGVDIGYATAILQIPADALPGWKLAVTMCDPPTLTLSAGVVPVGEGRWMILLADRGMKAAPWTWDAFLEENRRLITPAIYEALRPAAPPETIRHFHFTASLWKHFERLPRLPRRLLLVADAFLPIQSGLWPGNARGCQAGPPAAVRHGTACGGARPCRELINRFCGGRAGGAPDALGGVHQHRFRLSGNARRKAAEFRTGPAVRSGAFPGGRRRPDRPARSSGSCAAPTVFQPLTGAGYARTDRGGFRPRGHLMGGDPAVFRWVAPTLGSCDGGVEGCAFGNQAAVFLPIASHFESGTTTSLPTNCLFMKSVCARWKSESL
jgi:hypothetical protein